MREYRKPDLNAPRYRAKCLDILNKEFYNAFREAHPKYSYLKDKDRDSTLQFWISDEKAFELGAKQINEPEDHGFMYSRAFEDPDGNGFGPMWMDPAAA